MPQEGFASRVGALPWAGRGNPLSPSTRGSAFCLFYDEIHQRVSCFVFLFCVLCGQFSFELRARR